MIAVSDKLTKIPKSRKKKCILFFFISLLIHYLLSTVTLVWTKLFGLGAVPVCLIVHIKFCI